MGVQNFEEEQQMAELREAINKDPGNTKKSEGMFPQAVSKGREKRSSLSKFTIKTEAFNKAFFKTLRTNLRNLPLKIEAFNRALINTFRGRKD